MKHLTRLLILFLFILLYSVPVFSAPDPDNQGQMTVETFLASLDFQQGQINLKDNLVTLSLPDAFRYLSPEDAEKVLVDAWGNPPGNKTLGMIVPAETGLFSDKSWAVIISYEEDGHVSDEDAESINYDELLSQMQHASKKANKDRVDNGYEPIEIVGWAEKPFYDKQTHKLYWAKELKFGEADTNTLNYNIRILGRKGVLLLNIVSGMPQFQVINAQIPSLLAMTEFNAGSRYSDFNPSIDKIAAYGIAALVAGKVATKIGLLAKFGGILLALKKLWIIIVVAVATFFKKLFGKKTAK